MPGIAGQPTSLTSQRIFQLLSLRAYPKICLLSWFKAASERFSDKLLVKFLANAVLFVGTEGIVANHLALQAGQHKLHTEDHQQNANKQQWLVMNRLINKETAANHNCQIDQNTQHQCPEAQRHEQAQRLAQERRQKQHIEQIDQATCETPGTKFRDAKFAGMMMNLNLRHPKTAPVRHHRHKAMKFAVQLEVTILNNFAPVGLKAAVNVVQMHAG